MHNITHKRKAVSPVIATVILIAVAVALGIAVAFWASGLTSSFSKYEKLGVSTQYAVGVTGGGWQVNVGGQNTGSSDSTITQIQVNGIPIAAKCVYLNTANASATSCSSGMTSIAISVPSGQPFGLTLFLTGSAYSHGQTVQVTIITAAGNNYPASIVLP